MSVLIARRKSSITKEVQPSRVEEPEELVVPAQNAAH